jgi:hypothetical protein
VAGRGDAGRAVDIHPDVPLVGQLRLAGVNAHANPHRKRGECALRLTCCR